MYIKVDRYSELNGPNHEVSAVIKYIIKKYIC